MVLAGCATSGQPSLDEVQLARADSELPERDLLDVWIEIFDPGQLPEDDKEASGLSMEIRQAEARYIPVHLRGTLEKTGYWGAVRVVPAATEGADLLLQGRLLASDGITLEVEITALDSSGKQWFRKTYNKQVEASLYKARSAVDEEVFSAFYHAVANDLAQFRGNLERQDITRIRRIAEMRFAADMAPDAYADYLGRDAQGQYQLLRLPATDDPMMQRIRAIRERDFLLIDTLNGHFDNFYLQMQEPYFEWRKARSIEAEELRRVQREANKRKALGIAAILGAIAIEALGSDSTVYSTGSLRDIMVIGGIYATKRGFDMAAQTTIHREAIRELGESFSSETKPLVVEVEGETHELTGSAETQYAQWRGLLRQIYASETGLPQTEDLPAADSAPELPAQGAATEVINGS
jgi:hypothetical protein